MWIQIFFTLENGNELGCDYRDWESALERLELIASGFWGKPVSISVFTSNWQAR
jgi:hypothetical protein